MREIIDLIEIKTERGLRVTEAMARLMNNPDFQLLHEKLKDELHRLDVENRIEDDGTLFKQYQGACQTLYAIISQCEKAKTYI